MLLVLKIVLPTLGEETFALFCGQEVLPGRNLAGPVSYILHLEFLSPREEEEEEDEEFQAHPPWKSRPHRQRERLHGGRRVARDERLPSTAAYRET